MFKYYLILLAGAALLGKEIQPYDCIIMSLLLLTAFCFTLAQCLKYRATKNTQIKTQSIQWLIATTLNIALIIIIFNSYQ